MAVEVRLLVNGNNGCYERSRYKNTFAHCRQVEEFTVIEVQFGIWELVSCRRASDGYLVSVPGVSVFWICRRPHCC